MIVLVPDLEALLGEAGALPVCVGRILARGRMQALDPANYQSELLTGQSVPAAALTRLLDCPEDSQGAWLRADPVDLTPDISAVWLHPGALLALDSPAVTELVELFAEHGLEFQLVAPDRAYLRLNAPMDCEFQPPWALSGRSLDHVLPTGPDSAKWRKLLTECQVILHQHQAVIENGETPIPGSLWFWGAGHLPDAVDVQARVGQVVSTDPVILGLARWLELAQTETLPQLDQASDMLLEWPTDPALDAADNLARLDELLQGLWRRLQWGRLGSLVLSGRSGFWQLRSLDAWRFWQRPVRSFVSEAA